MGVGEAVESVIFNITAIYGEVAAEIGTDVLHQQRGRLVPHLLLWLRVDKSDTRELPPEFLRYKMGRFLQFHDRKYRGQQG
jgi:hypothetical protein